MREETQVDRLPDERAQKALDSSRLFLQQRLVPDVERVQGRIAQLEEDRRRYTALSHSLRGRMAKDAKQEENLLAPIGAGIHVPVRVSKGETLLVSLGLGSASETVWSTSTADVVNDASAGTTATGAKEDAGLYVELTAYEAHAFSVKKIVVLEKKIKLAREREALIQGHIELTTKSIEQLEALQQNPSANFLDFLHSS